MAFHIQQKDHVRYPNTFTTQSNVAKLKVNPLHSPP